MAMLKALTKLCDMNPLHINCRQLAQTIRRFDTVVGYTQWGVVAHGNDTALSLLTQLHDIAGSLPG